MSFVGAVLVVNNIDDHYLIQKLSFSDSRFQGWLAIMYAMIMLPVGMLIAKKMLNAKSIEKLFDRFTSKKIVSIVSESDSYLRITLIVLSFISVLSCFYTFHVIGEIPFFNLFKGLDPKALARIRIDASREFQGNVYLRNIFAISLTPILSYIAYGYYKMTKSKKDLLWFFVMFISSVMINTYSLAKSPLLVYLISFILLKILIEKQVSYKFFMLLGVFIVAFLAFMYLKFMGSANSTDVVSLFTQFNQGILGRIFLSQGAGTFLSFDIFPDKHPFLGISSFSKLFSEIFSIDNSDRSARIIMAIINPRAVEEGTAGVINTLFIGEAWANFGLAGALFSPIWVGFVIQWSYIILLRAAKNPVFLSLMVYLTYKWPVTGGFNDFVYNAGIAMMLLVFFLIVGFSIGARIVNTGAKDVGLINKNE